MDPVEMNFRNRKWMGKTRKSSRPNCNQKSSRPTQRGTDMLFFLKQDFWQQTKTPKNPQEVNHGKHRGKKPIYPRPIPNFKNPPPPRKSKQQWKYYIYTRWYSGCDLLIPDLGGHFTILNHLKGHLILTGHNKNAKGGSSPSQPQDISTSYQENPRVPPQCHPPRNKTLLSYWGVINHHCPLIRVAIPMIVDYMWSFIQ